MFGFNKSAAVIAPMHIVDAKTGPQIISSLLDNPQQATQLSEEQLYKLANMESVSPILMGQRANFCATSVPYGTPLFYSPGLLENDEHVMKACTIIYLDELAAGSDPAWSKARLVAMRHDGQTIAWVCVNNLWKRVI